MILLMWYAVMYAPSKYISASHPFRHLNPSSPIKDCIARKSCLANPPIHILSNKLIKLNTYPKILEDLPDYTIVSGILQIIIMYSGS